MIGPRFLLLAVIADLVLVSAGVFAQGAAPEKGGRVTVVVTETAGIRRSSYPVSTVLTLAEPVKDVDHMRLVEKGKPVAAQFRPSGTGADGIKAVVLDFNANHAPLENREYVVEYGPDVKPGPAPKGGLKVEAGKDSIRVIHSGLTFDVPNNLAGLLGSVQQKKDDFLRAGSAGLMLRPKDGEARRVTMQARGATKDQGPVVKSGPVAATLRFEGSEKLPGDAVAASVVELDFPGSKSWVCVRWSVEDAKGQVAGLGADLNLNVQGEPTLVDFGAGTFVYAQLRKDQSAMLRAGALTKQADAPAWQTFTGPTGKMTAHVVAPKSGATPAEGWAHVMDRQRCTALAVDRFAEPGQESEITIAADGRVQLWRHFGKGQTAPQPGTKTLTFWLHFVDVPVAVGARTSPQAMLAPLKVEVKK